MAYIKKFSDKRAKQNRLYEKLKRQYFIHNPECEHPDCDSTNITLHHMRGRVGDLLTDMRYFKSLCPYHHNWVELNPEASKELGLSLDRL